MKKFYLIAGLFLMLIPGISYSQCSTTNATGCLCPAGGGANCDLIPDIAIARLPLTQSSNYTEYPQVCNPPCSGNDGRLRLGVSTPIIGYGPLETRGTSKYVCGTDTVDAGTVANIPSTCPITGLSPKQLINQRVYHKNGNIMTWTDRAAGSMTYHSSHGHQHVDNWGIYTLRTSNGDPNPLNWPIIGTGTKLGFCLLDIGSCNGSSGYCTDSLGNTLNSSNIVNYGLGGGNYGCSNTVQGISNGYMDTYSQSLDGMWINLPAGLCNGTYYVVVQIDPLNYFLETNENNNVVAVPITLTQQGGALPTITAGGPTTFCTGGSVILTSSPATNYFWSNGATTQSITVSASGSYSVLVNSASACSSTSLPVTVTATSLTVNASATPSSICAGQSTQLSVTHNASGTSTVPIQFTNNTQVFIPDNNAAGVTSPITVSGINPATLSNGMLVSVKLNLTHTYDGDLIVSLISPSGNQINLSNRRGGSGDNFTNTIFSMSASAAIANGSAPFTGSYIPDGSFNSLTGNANGLWRLKVADVAAVDTGRIRDWTLTINNVVTVQPTFSWTSNTGFTSNIQNPVIFPGTTTIYNIVVTDASGCSGSSSVTITINPLPVVTADNVNGCVGNAIALSGTPSGGTWSVSNPYTGSSTTYTHTYTDVNGCTNTSSSANITVNPLPTVTAAAVSGCTGFSIALSGSPAGGTYSVSNPYTGPSTTYTYSYTDGNGCSNTSVSANITISPLPIVSFSGLSASYAVTASAVTLTGSPSGGTFSGPGITGNTFTPSAAGVGGPYTITYSYSDGNGCGNSSSQQTTIINCALPATPGNIISVGGTSLICPGNSKSYKITAVNGATSYTWTPPAGGIITTGQGTVQVSISYNAGFTATGILSVVANNACGSSPVRTLTITRNNPTTPGVISGLSAGVCNSVGVPYSVVNKAGITYNWYFNVATASVVTGQGTNAITADYNSAHTTGTLNVTASNACGTSAVRVLTVKSAPATPAAITGAASVCANQFGVPYSISPVATAISYTWSGPSGSHVSDGVTISSGATLTTTATAVTVNFGSTAGKVNVKANNACGAGTNKSLTIGFVCKSTEETFNGSSLELFPNPANEFVDVNYKSFLREDGILVISDVMGREIYLQPINSSEKEISIRINLNGINKGVYLLTINQAGQKITRKLIVE